MNTQPRPGFRHRDLIVYVVQYTLASFPMYYSATSLAAKKRVNKILWKRNVMTEFSIARMKSED